MTKVQSPYQNQLRVQAEQLRHEADMLPCGPARDGLLRQAKTLEETAVVEGWISSSQLHPPKEELNEPPCDQPKLDARTH